MTTASATSPNVKQAVPFFGVTSMEASMRFYVDGLGFKMKHWWIPDCDTHYPAGGKIRWCWLELGDAAIMLQEFSPGHRPTDTLGTGVSVCIMCQDALELYRQFKSRGVQMRQRPFVGTGCGWCRLPILMATASSSRAQPMFRKKASLKNK